MPGGVKMKEEKDEEEEESFNISDFQNVKVKVGVEDITVPEIEEEEMEPKLENSLKVEEEKKVKKEEEKMPTMDEEEVALIKLDLDNKTFTTRASLFNFRERLGDLVDHRGGRGGGPHHWCLVCGTIASTHQKTRNHVGGGDVPTVTPSSRLSHPWNITSVKNVNLICV